MPLIESWLQQKLANPYDYETTQDVEAISGAAMLVRRGVLQDLGGFGEAFIHCGEDLDLCCRIRAADWSSATNRVSQQGPAGLRNSPELATTQRTRCKPRKSQRLYTLVG